MPGEPLLVVLSGGSLSVGYFTGNNFNFSGATPSSIISAFQLAGTSNTFYEAGLFNTSVTTSIAYLDSTFVGNNIYVIAGDASTLASSTTIAVFAGATTAGGSTQAVFPAVPANGLAAASALSTTTSRVVFGTIIDSAYFTEPTGSFRGTFPQGVELWIMPEASTALLGALGALGLLRRRR